MGKQVAQTQTIRKPIVSGISTLKLVYIIINNSYPLAPSTPSHLIAALFVQAEPWA